MRMSLRLEPTRKDLTLPIHYNHLVQAMIYRSLDDAYIKPVRVSKKNEAVINFKGFWIKGWTGLYELSLPQPYFTLAYNAGPGSRNSQGFGMVEVVERRSFNIGGM